MNIPNHIEPKQISPFSITSSNAKVVNEKGRCIGEGECEVTVRAANLNGETASQVIKVEVQGVGGLGEIAKKVPTILLQKIVDCFV